MNTNEAFKKRHELATIRRHSGKRQSARRGQHAAGEEVQLGRPDDSLQLICGSGRQGHKDEYLLQTVHIALTRLVGDADAGNQQPWIWSYSWVSGFMDQT